MKKIIILFILFLSLLIFAEQDFYSMYLDSIETAFYKHDLNQVKKHYNILTSFDSNSYKPYYYYGYILFENKMFKEATEQVKKAVDLNPSEENYILYLTILSNYDLKLFKYEINTALSVYPASLNLNSLKMDYFNRINKPDSAYTYAIFVYKKNPNDASALYALAKYESARENYTPAITYLSKLLSLNNVKSEDYLLAGRIYANAKNYIASNKAFLKLTSSPYRYYSFHKLSDNYFLMDIYDSSLFMIDSLIKHYPDSTSPYHKFMAIAFKQNNSVLFDSLYIKIITNGIKDSSLLDNCAFQLFKNDKYNESSSLYKILFENRPDYFNKESVQAFFFMKDFTMTKSILNRFQMNTASDSFFVYKFYGLNFYKQSIMDSSEFYFEKAFCINDTDTNLIKNLANLYYTNQKSIKLTELIESIKENYPDLYDNLYSKYFKKQE